MKNLFSFELKVGYMRPVILALLRFGRQNGLQYNGTFQALFLQFAAVFIRNGNIAGAFSAICSRIHTEWKYRR